MTRHLKTQLARAIRLISFVLSAFSITAPFLHTALAQYPTAAAIVAVLEVIWRQIRPATPVDPTDPSVTTSEFAELGKIFSKYLSGQRPVTPEFKTELQTIAGDHPVPAPPPPPASP